MDKATIDYVMRTLEYKAQADWTDRKNETFEKDVVTGIHIGYDRAIEVLREMSDRAVA